MRYLKIVLISGSIAIVSTCFSQTFGQEYGSPGFPNGDRVFATVSINNPYIDAFTLQQFPSTSTTNSESTLNGTVNNYGSATVRAGLTSQTVGQAIGSFTINNQNLESSFSTQFSNSGFPNGVSPKFNGGVSGQQSRYLFNVEGPQDEVPLKVKLIISSNISGASSLLPGQSAQDDWFARTFTSIFVQGTSTISPNTQFDNVLSAGGGTATKTAELEFDVLSGGISVPNRYGVFFNHTISGISFGDPFSAQGTLSYRFEVSDPNYKVVPVPEPATIAAVGLGLAALVRRRRRVF